MFRLFIMYILAITSDISSIMAVTIHGDGSIVAEEIRGGVRQYYGYEEAEEEDVRDSFTSILNIRKEEYQEHEISIKSIYQESLRNRNFSRLEEIAEREKGALRSPIAKAFLSHILLSGLISEVDEFEGRRHSRRCQKFFKELNEDKWSGVNLFLKGTLHEHTAKKIVKEERRRKVLDDAFDAYQEAASKFKDDEAQLRLGGWYRSTNPNKAKKWYRKVVEQNKEGTKERAEACLKELDSEELILQISSPLSSATTEEDVSPIPSGGGEKSIESEIDTHKTVTSQKKAHKRVTASSKTLQGIF